MGGTGQIINGLEKLMQEENIEILKDNEVESYPLAGTIKRGKSEVEDKDLASYVVSSKLSVCLSNSIIYFGLKVATGTISSFIEMPPC